MGRIVDHPDIILDPEEHTDFVCISSLEDIDSELIVPYLIDIYIKQKNISFNKEMFFS